ncbi:glycosyltransferase [Sphingobacterium lactis]|uniref:Glycosyltransferase, GT2 family n=1 Tax=Sphingobacterium lactis TaxID=797291 RepID=A0A1H6CLL4_9SPHI|nr:glycosyltransferase [Sphingobacterium lactis]SEG73583.1 Glycosyltransferase, GT2 family [Sphingobacterium lactis]
MISIVISSYNSSYFQNIQNNIHQTIGIEYELIQIWNPGIFSINEAYEKGLNQAKYEYILFIHEDLIFLNNGWGKYLLKFLELPNVGLIGLAGGNYFPDVPNDWFITNEYNYINLIHGLGDSEENLRNFEENFHQVLGLDGVFIFGKKSIFLEIGFDQNISGYHAYDLSISLRTAKKYTNYVINSINVHHISIGNRTLEWFNSTIQVHESITWKFDHPKDKYVEKELFRRFSKYIVHYWGRNLKSLEKIIKYYPRKYLHGIEHFKTIWFLVKLFTSKKFNNLNI